MSLPEYLWSLFDSYKLCQSSFNTDHFVVYVIERYAKCFWSRLMRHSFQTLGAWQHNPCCVMDTEVVTKLCRPHQRDVGCTGCTASLK
uniref:Uncharacterized protein n=1 Tax=Anguilla anguilla TaxID=7936 RepID=A0A0E9XDL5_ANGAN